MARRYLIVVSLIGLAVSIGLWAVSFWNHFYLGERYDFHIMQGALRLTVHDSWGYSTPGWGSYGFCGLRSAWRPVFGAYPDDHFGQFDFYVRLPLWMTTMACAAVLAYCRPLRSVIKSWRRKHGLCVHCGYDIRYSRNHCSECGIRIWGFLGS